VIFTVNVYDKILLGIVTFEMVAIFCASATVVTTIGDTLALVAKPNSFLTSSSSLKYFKSNYLLATGSYLIIKSEFTAENILYFYRA
jgi:hypothetical protein